MLSRRERKWSIRSGRVRTPALRSLVLASSVERKSGAARATMAEGFPAVWAAMRVSVWDSRISRVQDDAGEAGGAGAESALVPRRRAKARESQVCREVDSLTRRVDPW